ncbi:MAG: hypothetical protein GF311_19620 [Candidatus Lokiarchaeota archaeon]|nr:hypothetical protein [Candidatus Lokiarchaeota archaeon]
MNFDTGMDDYQKKKDLPIIPTGDISLDKLLLGGFQKELMYLVYGPKAIITDILLRTCVNAQIILGSQNQSNTSKDVKVAYIDGSNRFNPYTVSKYAASQRLSPRKVLENILITRAFTWEQMVEILQNKITQLENIEMVIVAGITQLFEYDKAGYEGLLKAIDGIKQLLSKTAPLIILTGPKEKYSQFKPKGGKIIQHFGNVLVMINEDERKVSYRLIQHPAMPEKQLLRKKHKNPKKRSDVSNAKLDEWL